MAGQSCDVARKNYFGDEKAEKLMTWGAMFEAEFEYETAMRFYQDAF